MKLYTLLCLLLISLFSFGENVIIKHYNFNITYNQVLNRLELISKFKLVKTDTSDNIKLLFNSNIIINEFKEIKQKGGEKNVKYNQLLNDTLQIILNNKNQTSYTFEIKYTLPKDSFSFAVAKTIFLTTASRWYPFLYTSIASFDIVINIPENNFILATGNCLETKKSNGFIKQKWHSNYCSKIGIVIDEKKNYIIDSIIKGNKKFFFYNPIEDTTNHSKLNNNIVAAYDFCEKLFGSNGINTVNLFEILDNTVNLCQSQQNGLIFYSQYYRDMYYKYNVEFLSHEIVHEWWGNSLIVKNDSKNSLFIEESFTEYIKMLFVKSYEVDSIYQREVSMHYNNFKNFITVTNSKSISDITNLASQENSVLIYSKGPLIFDCISKKISYEQWLSNIKKCYQENKNKNIDFELFIKYLTNKGDSKLNEYIIEELNSKNLDNLCTP